MSHLFVRDSVTARGSIPRAYSSRGKPVAGSFDTVKQANVSLNNIYYVR